MQSLTQSLVVVFVVSTMLGVGLMLTVRDIVASLHDRRWLVRALLANLVVLPALALGVSRLLGLDAMLTAALLVLATAPGGPVVVKLATLAKGDPALAVGLVVTLMLIGIVAQPLVLPFLSDVRVSTGAILRTLLFTVLTPLLLGFALRARRPSLPERLQMPLQRVSTVSMILVVAMLSALHWRELMELSSSGAFPASLLFVAFGAAAGWPFGGPRDGPRRIFDLVLQSAQHGSGFRHRQPELQRPARRVDAARGNDSERAYSVAADAFLCPPPLGRSRLTQWRAIRRNGGGTCHVTIVNLAANVHPLAHQRVWNALHLRLHVRQPSWDTSCGESAPAAMGRAEHSECVPPDRLRDALHHAPRKSRFRRHLHHAAHATGYGRGRVVVGWRQSRGPLRCGGLGGTKSVVRSQENDAFYQRNPEQWTGVSQLRNAKPTPNSQGLRLGNYVQVREAAIELELENIFTGKKTVKEGLDSAVERGNAILRQFGVTHGAAASGEI